jgi:predicted permease
MRWLDVVRLRWRSLFQSPRVENELDGELRFHFDQQLEENLAHGMQPDEARYAALRAIGGIAQIKEECRDMRGTNWIDNTLQDLRYGVRMLWKSRGLTAIVTLTLALGVGVNTAIFSVLNGWLLRPLPARAPEQIMVLAAQNQQRRGSQFSYPAFLDFQNQASVFSHLFAYGLPSFGGLSAGGHAAQFGYSVVTSNYFTALGVNPALGRLLVPGESEKPGDQLLVVLGYSFWQRRFAGDPTVVGRQVLFNGRPASIIGVAAPEFHGAFFSADMDGYVSLSSLPAYFFVDRGDRRLVVLGRLRDRVSLRQAQSASSVIAERVAGDYPATDKGITVRVIPEKLARPAPLVTSFVPLVAALFLVLAGLVLAVAGMSVANVLAAQATARQREMAVRASLGASRSRLIRQMMTESLLLSLLGAATGVTFGKWTVGFAGSLLHSVSSSSSNISLSIDTSFDWRVFSYALAAAIFTAFLMSAWPAVRADVNAALHAGARNDSSARGGIRGFLVVAQVAGSLMLLIAAGLFVRSLDRARHVDLGFDPGHVLAVAVDPHEIGYDETRARTFYRELEDRLRAIPGVLSASVSFTVPMGSPSEGAAIHVEGRAPEPGRPAPAISFNSVTPAYFETMRVPMTRGREFRDSDGESALPVAIVNQAMARKLWPDEDPIGKRFRLKSAAGPFVEVIGVTANGQYWFFSPDPQPYFYVPAAQHFSFARTLELRSTLPPESLIPAVEAQIRRLAPGLPVIDVRTMRDTVEGLAGLFVFRLAATLATVMGILGLTLAVVGVYGVVSFSVSRRTHEIGVRIALGADRRDILILVSKRAVRLVAAGVIAGLILAAAFSRVMTRLLIGVGATDPVTYTVVAALLATVAALACWIPTRRALRVDPMVALRNE